MLLPLALTCLNQMVSILALACRRAGSVFAPFPFHQSGLSRVIVNACDRCIGLNRCEFCSNNTLFFFLELQDDMRYTVTIGR